MGRFCRQRPLPLPGVVWLACLSLLVAIATPASALDRITKRDAKGEVVIEGRILVEAQDGGLLVEARDGVLWTIEPAELVEVEKTPDEFRALSVDELASQLLSELPPGFEVYATQHYLICHNTSRAYAQWAGALFERLYLAFTNYWSRRDFDLREPEFPLVALVFADKASYAAYAQAELGNAVDSIIGYYSLRTNRITMYDLTGVQAIRGPNDRRSSAAQINQMLARPEAERLVATVIHEATHQIAFNCGLQTRYADIPLWLSEGIAVYFETPDLKSTAGWRSFGEVNRVRLAGFRDYLRRRRGDSLVTLLTDDNRLRSSATANDAYSEAWALNYFLIRQRPQQYLQYLKLMSSKRRMFWDDPATRLADFQKIFGSDLSELDTEFLRYMSKVR